MCIWRRVLEPVISTHKCNVSNDFTRTSAGHPEPHKGKYILDTREHRAYILDMKARRTLQEAIVYFCDPQRAFDYAVSLRWPNGKVHCPRCSSESNYFIKTRKLWLCR